MSETRYDEMEWLNIYGQYTYHGEATIKGTVRGLTLLRDAIDAAIKSGDGQAKVYASDGEGYSIDVLRTSTQAALGTNEYIYEKHGKLMADEAERAREMGLRNPFGNYKRIDAEPLSATPLNKEEGAET